MFAREVDNVTDPPPFFLLFLKRACRTQQRHEQCQVSPQTLVCGGSFRLGMLVARLTHYSLRFTHHSLTTHSLLTHGMGGGFSGGGAGFSAGLMSK